MDLIWWAVIALGVSVIAGGLGFTGVAAGAATIARVMFGVFLLIAIVIFVLIVLGIGAAT